MELRRHKQFDAMYQPMVVMFPQWYAIKEDQAPTLNQLNHEMFEVRN